MTRNLKEISYILQELEECIQRISKCLGTVIKDGEEKTGINVIVVDQKKKDK